FDLQDQANFVNEDCSKIIIGVDSYINSANFENAGVIIDYSNNDSYVFENTGLIYNLGGGDFTYTIGGPNSTIKTTLDHVWTGCMDSDWSKVGNWSSLLPTAQDHAIIVAETNNPILSQNETIKSLMVEENALLTLNNKLTVNGSSTTGVEVDGTIEVNNDFIINNATTDGLIVSSTGTINVADNLEVKNAGNNGIEIAGIVNIDGTMRVEDAAVDGMLIKSSGALNLEQDGSLVSLGHGGNQIINETSGYISMDQDATFFIFGEVSSTGICLENNGEIDNNNGTLTIIIVDNGNNGNILHSHIVNNDIINNDGTLSIVASNPEDNILFRNNGQIVNNDTILISSLINDNENIGFANAGHFFNNGATGGSFEIQDNNTFLILDKFENTGSVMIEDSINISSDTLKNIAPGIIETKSTAKI
ncbi:MAG: hypothetical protein AAGK97_15415, partial [Bacteroidota bacterium]